MRPMRKSRAIWSLLPLAAQLHRSPTGSSDTRHTQEPHTMEAERINLIGTTLEDLTERTQELRRYL